MIEPSQGFSWVHSHSVESSGVEFRHPGDIIKIVWAPFLVVVQVEPIAPSAGNGFSDALVDAFNCVARGNAIINDDVSQLVRKVSFNATITMAGFIFFAYRCYCLVHDER